MEIGNFKVERAIDLPEIRVKLWVLEEKRTGAKVLHCAADDQENAFCIALPTQPKSSNGVAHILEHTVLCGSKRFPVRDPFFLMLRRSLNTFLNAFTGSDFTCYPAATQNPKDFYNLLDVYLDAVFFPSLNRLSFLQEGHRLEWMDERLKFQGVVFNEMKGALANPLSRLDEVVSSQLFQGLTYAHNSGGDPKEIPKLTHAELKAFHQEFYHPSRALFYFYGNLPLEKHLEFLNEKVLQHVQPLKPLPPIPPLKRFDQPQLFRGNYPISKEEDPQDKTLVSSSVVTCSILDQVEALALSTLSVILLETDASPLKLALLKSGLCKQVLAHIDTEISEIPISIILRGVQSDQAEGLLQTLHSLKVEIANTPFSKEAIESALHQLELSRTEISHDPLPYGLNLFMRAGLLMQHGGKPEDALVIHSLFRELRKRIDYNKLYFNDLMKKWLVKNPHRLDVILEPDPTLEEKEHQAEEEWLRTLEKGLKDEEKQHIVQESQALEELQEAEEENLSAILPMLDLQDIPLSCQDFPLYTEPHLFFHDCFTNDLVYATLSVDLPPLPPEDLPYLRLFVLLLTQMGAQGKSYIEMLEWVQAKTGGVFASLALNPQIADPNLCQPALQIQGKGLQADREELFKILATYTDPQFIDPPRVKEVLLKHYTALRNSIASSALKYATGLSTQGMNGTSALAYRLFGLEWYWQVKGWVESLDQTLKPLAEKLQQLCGHFFSGNRELILSCTQDQFEPLKKSDFHGITGGENRKTPLWNLAHLCGQGLSQGRIISSPVAFLSSSLKSPGYLDPISPALHLASCLLDNEVLHTEIREKGGAYGGGSSYQANAGIFSFYSYRDPHIFKTLELFAQSVQELKAKEISGDKILEGKLEMIQGFDAPVSPGSRAHVGWSWLKEGKSLALRQSYRDRLLATDWKRVQEALDQLSSPKVVVAFAGKDLLEKENTLCVKQGKEPLPLFSVEQRG